MTTADTFRFDRTVFVELYEDAKVYVFIARAKLLELYEDARDYVSTEGTVIMKKAATVRFPPLRLALFLRYAPTLFIGVLCVLVMRQALVLPRYLELENHCPTPTMSAIAAAPAAASGPLPPPEELTWIDKCSEKCKHIPEMCNGLYEEAHFPAPGCRNWSFNTRQDFYFRREEETRTRNSKTVELVKWAVNRTENGPQKQCMHSVGETYNAPKMYPEEFEIVTKTMINAKAKTYLEWGSGESTSFYPLLVHGKDVHAYVIDAYKPQCDRVLEDTTVQCMEPFLTYECVQPKHADGSAVEQGELGSVKSEEDKKILVDAYVNAPETMKIPNNSIDVVLLGGRFRISCALKSLHYLSPNGVLVTDGFWLRPPEYRNAFLEYYDVIGHARSVAVMKRKPDTDIPPDWANAWEKYLHMEK